MENFLLQIILNAFWKMSPVQGFHTDHARSANKCLLCYAARKLNSIQQLTTGLRMETNKTFDLDCSFPNLNWSLPINALHTTALNPTNLWVVSNVQVEGSFVQWIFFSSPTVSAKLPYRVWGPCQTLKAASIHGYRVCARGGCLRLGGGILCPATLTSYTCSTRWHSSQCLIIPL